MAAIPYSEVESTSSDDSNAKQIRSIPEGIWWSLITMTTVGYGDKIPVSFGGKIAGSCCAMMGILCMSFPVPGLFYKHFYVLTKIMDVYGTLMLMTKLVTYLAMIVTIHRYLTVEGVTI